MGFVKGLIEGGQPDPAAARNLYVQFIKRILDVPAVVVAGFSGARPNQLGVVEKEGAIVSLSLNMVFSGSMVDEGKQESVAHGKVELTGGQHFGVDRAGLRVNFDFCSG